MSTATKRAYLLAHPAGHSLSPKMHGAALEALGLDASYEALDVPPERLAAAVARFRSDGTFLGANVTTPHKRAVMPLLDALTPAAEAVGAVNTIVPRGGLLTGDNTDVAGFLRALEEHGGPRGAVAVVLGAGGAARAVVHALRSVGDLVMVAARDPSAAAALANSLSRGGPSVAALGAGDLPSVLTGTQILVNATTVGMQGGPAENALPLDVDLSLLPRDALVYDLVYRPRRTPLLVAAAELGLDTLDGLSMLVWQGAESLRAWTGLEPPTAVMLEAVGG